MLSNLIDIDLSEKEEEYFRSQLEDVDENSPLEVVAVGWVEPREGYYGVILKENDEIIRGNIPRDAIKKRGFSGETDQFCALIKYESRGKEKTEVVKLERDLD